jgi:dihydrofolate reductase
VALIIIAAVARNGAIGRNNALLCRLSEDLQFFKRTTLGHPLLMGRRTFESIGRPLPGRRNIVLTRDPAWRAEGIETAASLPAALTMTAAAPKRFVIGGAQLYAQALPLADELVLTEIGHDFEADTFFPRWDRSAFIEAGRTRHQADAGWPYERVTYQRKLPAGASKTVPAPHEG